MSRLFRRGELKAAVLEIIAEGGPTHGYAVLAALGTKVGSSWQPSPGAVYPALVSLEDAGLITGADRDEARVYEVTAAGRDALDAQAGVIDRVARRAVDLEASPRLASLVDRFAAEIPGRGVRLDPVSRTAATDILERARTELTELTRQHDPPTKKQVHNG